MSTWPPIGWTLRVDETDGQRMFRAVRIVGPEYIGPVRKTYAGALTDATRE